MFALVMPIGRSILGKVKQSQTLYSNGKGLIGSNGLKSVCQFRFFCVGADEAKTTVKEKQKDGKGGIGKILMEKQDAERKQQDFEIKDPAIIFNTVWQQLEREVGRENLRFPKEIIWLNGAPGSGKGTNTPFIQKTLGIESAPIVMSDLFQQPMFKEIIMRGDMIGDAQVVDCLFRELIKPERALGALVDGFPRTGVQVECIKMLSDQMLALRREFYETELRKFFRRPIFRIAVLYVSENESLERQLTRGQQVREHNERVKDSGMGKLKEERNTDFDKSLIKKRYQIFKQHYETLLKLRGHFPFHLINAQGDIEEVQKSIMKQFEYQSSQELNEETFDNLQHIPIASDISKNARQELIRRLDDYQANHTQAFTQMRVLIQKEFVPILRRHAFSGFAIVRTEDIVFANPFNVDMVLDMLSERGYQCSFNEKLITYPTAFDPVSHKVSNISKWVYAFHIKFPSIHLRKKLEMNTEQ
eukprot:Nk52_evm2s281 gene=Nk52_evmTU2s281